jgi:myo-inositol-1-phosphate synthase
VFIAREKYWQQRFEKKGLPVIGDDIKSQVGATITHRVLSRLFVERGVRIDRTYQINFGGNTDFLNMLERERLESKKISKTSAVTSIIPYGLAEEDVHVGPSDYIPWLKDRKWCHIRMEGTTFGDVPLNLEMKLEVWDSPNSAGVVIDAVRCAKIGLDHGLSGALIAPSSYFKKSPPVQIPDDQARELTERFITDPKGVERLLREKAPVVKRESPMVAGLHAPAYEGSPNGMPAAGPRPVSPPRAAPPSAPKGAARAKRAKGTQRAARGKASRGRRARAAAR